MAPSCGILREWPLLVAYSYISVRPASMTLGVFVVGGCGLPLLPGTPAGM